MAQTVPIIPDSPTPENPVAPTILAVIPARLASSRLPHKVLRPIAGRPMLAWVHDAVAACPQLHRVVVATDSDEVADLCRQHGWEFRITSPDLPSGSDRVQAVATEIPADIYVNIQGDEPLLQPQHLTDLLRPFHLPHVQVSTLRVACTPENIHNPNAVKVACSPVGRALYFSRSPIPYHRDPGPAAQFWKHLGLYAYRANALRRFTELPPSPLEVTERLEQLRFLEHDIPIHVATTALDTVGVDTEDDLRAVEHLLGKRHPSSAATRR